VGGVGLRPASENGQQSTSTPPGCESMIVSICDMPWQQLHPTDLMRVAKAYYYFSVQFRENLEIACLLYPNDALLRELRAGECDTDNLSPWPGVASPGERMNHDEFVRRLLLLENVGCNDHLTQVGRLYLDRIRRLGSRVRAGSIAGYEDGGLSRVFGAMLRAPSWDGAGPSAFKFFLEQHVSFDADDGGGHGRLARHLRPGDEILPLWTAFRDLLLAATPQLALGSAGSYRAAYDGAPTPLDPDRNITAQT